MNNPFIDNTKLLRVLASSYDRKPFDEVLSDNNESFALSDYLDYFIEYSQHTPVDYNNEYLLSTYLHYGGNFKDEDIEKLTQIPNLFHGITDYISFIEYLKGTEVTQDGVNYMLKNYSINGRLSVLNMNKILENKQLSEDEMVLLLPRVYPDTLVHQYPEYPGNLEKTIDLLKDSAEFLLVFLHDFYFDANFPIDQALEALEDNPKIESEKINDLMNSFMGLYNDDPESEALVKIINTLLDNYDINIKHRGKYDTSFSQIQLSKLINVCMDPDIIKKFTKKGYRPKQHGYSFFSETKSLKSKNRTFFEQNIIKNINYLTETEVRNKKFLEITDFTNVNNKHFYGFMETVASYHKDPEFLNFIKEKVFLDDDLATSKLKKIISKNYKLPTQWKNADNPYETTSFDDYFNNLSIESLQNPIYPVSIWEDYYSDAEFFVKMIEKEDPTLFQEWLSFWLQEKGEQYKNNNRDIINILSYCQSKSAVHINNSFRPLLDLVSDFSLRHRGIPYYPIAQALFNQNPSITEAFIANGANIFDKGENSKYILNDLFLGLNTYRYRHKAYAVDTENILLFINSKINELPDDFLPELSQNLDAFAEKFKYVEQKKSSIYCAITSLREGLPKLQLGNLSIAILIENLNNTNCIKTVNALKDHSLTTIQSNKVFSSLVKYRNHEALDLYLQYNFKEPTEKTIKNLQGHDSEYDSMIKKYLLRSSNKDSVPDKQASEDDNYDDLGL